MIYVINYMVADPVKKEKAWDWLQRFAAYNTRNGVDCKAMWNMTGGQRDQEALRTRSSGFARTVTPTVSRCGQ